MKSSARYLVALGISVSGVWAALGTTAWTEVKDKTIRAANEATQEALRCELTGANAERDRLLTQVLERVPNSPHAMWHTGNVREGGSWHRYDEVVRLSAETADWAEYRRRRQDTPDTVEGQVGLARWCAAHQLADQMRAHATETLRLDPDHAEARTLLGYRREKGVWYNPDEVREANGAVIRGATLLDKWMPKFQPLVRQLADPKHPERPNALRYLRGVKDPAAIPAMEAILATHNEHTALALVEALQAMPASEAAVGLARESVYSPWDNVRAAATQGLQTRPLDSYVPAMLAAMSSPIMVKAELYTASTGRLATRQVLTRDGQYHSVQITLDTEYQPPPKVAGRPNQVDPRTRTEQQRQADVASGQARVASQNQAIAKLNGRVCEVLGRTTGNQSGPEPEHWWDWWNQHNEVFLVGSKPRQEINQKVRITVPPPPPPSKDCLVAGTPVWTDAGLLPIERIKIGDRVLCQEPQTGRLVYQPVLSTTVRPASQSVRIVFDKGFLQCSGGHPLWIDGKSWVKAREIEAGAYLHTVNGALLVRSVYPAGTEETYNLIVADAHSYFVTSAMILSHDNTIRKSVSELVPGLASR